MRGKNLMAAIPFECPVLNVVGEGSGGEEVEGKEKEGEARGRREEGVEVGEGK